MPEHSRTGVLILLEQVFGCQGVLRVGGGRVESSGRSFMLQCRCCVRNTRTHGRAPLTHRRKLVPRRSKNPRRVDRSLPRAGRHRCAARWPGLGINRSPRRSPLLWVGRRPGFQARPGHAAGDGRHPLPAAWAGRERSVNQRARRVRHPARRRSRSTRNCKPASNRVWNESTGSRSKGSGRIRNMRWKLSCPSCSGR